MRPLVVEQELGQGPRQLGLADAGRPQEDERADRPVGVFQPRPRPRTTASATAVTASSWPITRWCSSSSRCRSFCTSPSSSLDTGNAGPAADDLGDVLLVHFLLDAAWLAACLAPALLLACSCFSSAGQLAVLQLARRGSSRRSRSACSISCLVCSICSRSLRSFWALLPSPACHWASSFVCLLFQIGQLLFQLGQPLLARRRPSPSQGDSRSISSCMTRRQISSSSRRHGVDLGAQLGRRLVHQVDGLVGQEAVGDVAVGQHRRRHQGRVLDAHAVVALVALLQAAQDRDGVLDHG